MCILNLIVYFSHFLCDVYFSVSRDLYSVTSALLAGNKYLLLFVLFRSSVKSSVYIISFLLTTRYRAFHGENHANGFRFANFAIHY